MTLLAEYGAKIKLFADDVKLYVNILLTVSTVTIFTKPSLNISPRSPLGQNPSDISSKAEPPRPKAPRTFVRGLYGGMCTVLNSVQDY